MTARELEMRMYVVWGGVLCLLAIIALVLSAVS
jgi:hypothetical protein